jgi:phosphate-selective porin OprO/OprP
MLALGALLLAVGQGAQAQEKSVEERLQLLEQAFKTSEKTFRVYWKDDTRFETLDKEVVIRIGGRIQLDWNFTLEGDEVREVIEAPFAFDQTQPEDQVFFRRSRIFIRGTLYKFVTFKAEYDFAGENATFTDVYLGLQDIPYLGEFLVGRFKVPFGLEELTSSRFITFQERSLPTEAFAPSREIGFYVGNTLLDEHLTWAFSVTRASDSTDAVFATQGASKDINVTARLTGLPSFVDNGRQLIHLGFAYAFRSFIDPDDGDNFARFRTRPEARIGEDRGLRFVDTDQFGAKAGHLFGFEGAFVLGPFSLQGEAILATWFDCVGFEGTFDQDEIEDATLFGYYVFVSYFLTGEHRPYSTSSGTFDRPRPKKNFLRGGLGAWEVAVRFSSIDLSDASDFAGDARDGGKEYNFTFGLNWYLNPNTRVTFNYIYGIVDDRTWTEENGAGTPLSVGFDKDELSVVSMRFQVDF